MIIGHQKQWNFLKKSAELGQVSHGFLFFGQEQLGKKKIALEFVKVLNCQNTSTNKKPCQVCYSCQSIEKLQHPDLLLVEPQGKEIQISQIRDLSQRLFLRPFQSFFKAAILDQAHLMNQEAQAALLKTLEEPKGNTVLILVTEYPEMLSPTILSRVQKIRFHPVKREEIESYLSQKGLSQDKIRLISSFSLGRPGTVIDFLLKEEKLEDERQKLTNLIKIISPDSDLASRFQYVKKIIQQIQDLSKNKTTPSLRSESLAPSFSQNSGITEILESWLRYFREFLLLKVGALSVSDSYPEFQKILKRYSVSKIKEIIKTLQKIIFSLSTTNINSRLALEIIMLEL